MPVNEGVAPGGAALLGVVVGEHRAFAADAVDVGRLADHQAAMINRRLHPADVVAHDEQDVRLLFLRGRRSRRTDRRQADGEDRRPQAAREPRGGAAHFSFSHRYPLLDM